MTDSIKELAERLDFPRGKKFTFVDDPGEHDPCYVVMPDGAMLPLNNHATPGVDIARAHFIINACNAALIGGSPRIEEIVKAAMLDAWNDFCSDTGNHPPDLEHGRGQYLKFTPSKWADATAKIVVDRLAHRGDGAQDLYDEQQTAAATKATLTLACEHWRDRALAAERLIAQREDVGQTRIADGGQCNEHQPKELSGPQEASLLEVLMFYADPENYHAIAFMADRPAGEFADDVSEDIWVKELGYGRPMPGKRARDAIEKLKAELGIATLEEFLKENPQPNPHQPHALSRETK